MSVSYSIGYSTKAVNSTSRVFTSSISGDVLIKEPSDFRNPVLQVKGSPGNYNYMSFNNAYYWIDKVISFPNEIIEVHAHLDPLATYQDDIVDTKVFASFHSTARNSIADDPRFSPEKVNRTDGTAADIFDSTATLSGGSVILTVSEAAGSSHQGVKTYALSLSDFADMLKNLRTSLYENTWDAINMASDINTNSARFTTPDDVANMLGGAITTLGHDFLKALSDIVSNIGGFGSWRDNIIKAVYVPFAVGNIPGGSTNQNIHLGYLDTGKSAKPCDPVYVKTKSGTVDVPWDGKCATYPFLRNSRFSQFQVICCGGQYATFSSDLIKDLDFNASLGWYSAIDMMSGDWGCVLTADSGSNKLRLASFGGTLGIDITGMIGRGGMGMGVNAAITGFKIAGNALSYGISGSAYNTAETAGQIGCGVLTNFMRNEMGEAGSGTSGHGISSVFLDGSSGYNNIHIEGVCGYPAILDGVAGYTYEDYCARYGFPCNGLVSLALDNAFVVCSGAYVECKGNQQDQAFINSVLNSGILMEA